MGGVSNLHLIKATVYIFKKIMLLTYLSVSLKYDLSKR